ncbi:MAG: hypothetical protein WCG35_10450 [Betaproteobacteria bacterium]
MIKNDRFWTAIVALVTYEKDVRHRVVLACQILDKMQKDELPKHLYERLEEIKEQAGKKGALRNVDGNVIKDRYENTITLRKNRTYSKLAGKIFSVYEEFNSN